MKVNFKIQFTESLGGCKNLIISSLPGIHCNVSNALLQESINSKTVNSAVYKGVYQEILSPGIVFSDMLLRKIFYTHHL